MIRRVGDGSRRFGVIRQSAAVPLIRCSGNDAGNQNQRDQPAAKSALRCGGTGQLAHYRGSRMQRRRLERGRLRNIGQMRKQILRVEMQQACVIAYETAAERASRQLAETLFLQRFDLPRRQLQLLRDLVERKPGCLARGPEARTGPGRRGGRQPVDVVWQLILRRRHSQASVVMALVSTESGKRLRSCVTYDSSACLSPSLRSIQSPRYMASGGGVVVCITGLIHLRASS